MVGGIAAGYGLGTFAIDAGLVPGTVVVADAGSPEAVDPRIDAVEQLIATHDCWTGSTDRPADLDRKLPGHVVDQVFGVESTPGLVVYAFCR